MNHLNWSLVADIINFSLISDHIILLFSHSLAATTVQRCRDTEDPEALTN